MDSIKSSVGMVNGVNAFEISLDHVLNALLVMGPITHLIFKGYNFIPPPSVHGVGVEEPNINISITKPINSCFLFSKVLLTSEDV